MPEYGKAEQRVWLAICDRFNIPQVLPESVIRADMVALATERRDLMPQHHGEWQCLEGVPAMPERITPMSAQEASIKFFSRLMELMQGDHRRRMST